MNAVGNSNLENQNVSYFEGSTWQLIGYRILSVIVCIITLGIAYPWMLCMVKGWETGHTVINGRKLKFNGHGHQLIGKYLLWLFLTIITLGIYGIWFGLGMKKWVVKHTFYADETDPVDSYFSGGAGGYFGIHILSFILTFFTLGFGKAWAETMVLKWETGHTHIGGSPLEFGGTGGQLFVKYLLLIILTPLTLGIYALCFTVIYLKWQVKNTDAVYQTTEVQAQARGQEATVIQNFVKYRLAANDQEVAAVKSGYTGKEDDETLERLAEEDNSFALYHLAKKLKGDGALYEGRALELLQKAVDGKYHPALFELAKQLPSEQAVSMLIEAAQCGNADASWLLAAKYREASDLAQAAYWFKVALEWGVPDAKEHADEYDALIKSIALQLSENRKAVDEPKGNNAISLALGIAGIIIYIVSIIGLWFNIIPIVRFVLSIRYVPIIGLMIAIAGLFIGIAGIQRNKKGRVIAGILLNLMSIVLTLFSWAVGTYPGYQGLRLFYQDGPQTVQMENISLPSQEPESLTKPNYDNQTDTRYAENMETPVMLVDAAGIVGRYYTSDGVNGVEIEYILDDFAYFDREEQVLYIQFGVEKCEASVQLRCDNGWCTQEISSGYGITMANYPYDEPPHCIELWTENGSFINSHSLNIAEGTSDEVAYLCGLRYHRAILGEADKLIEDLAFAREAFTFYSVAAFGEYNNNFDYMIDEFPLYVRDQQVLYIPFALMHGEEQVWLGFENEGYVIIPQGRGITQVYICNGQPPSSIEVWTDRGYLINTHLLSVTECTTAEAEAWFAQKYGDGNPLNVSSINDVDISTSIVGEWELYIMEDDGYLEKLGWVFNADGTYDFFSYLCFATADTTDIYYDGQYWNVGASAGEEGSYAVNGNEIIIQGTDYTFGEENTRVIPIDFFDGEVLHLDAREYRRAN